VTELVTPRLLLRRPRVSDLDAMFDVMSDPRAMRYWSTLPHDSLEITAAWLAREIEQLGVGGDDFMIEYEGRVIGKVGAWSLPEFGFILHPDSWGRGFATEASAAFIAYAFRTTPVAELTADVDPRNAASLHVLGKLGFVETGRAENTFLLGDEWCHSVYLALPRPVAGS
jgi:[ribosomal protein S5]-alanine N-acetyltransferase